MAVKWRETAREAMGSGGTPRQPGYGNRREDRQGEEVKPPRRLHMADTDPFDDEHIERDQEHVRHRELSQPGQCRLKGGAQQIEMDQRDSDCLQHGREECEHRDQKRQEHVRFPKRLQARDGDCKTC